MSMPLEKWSVTTPPTDTPVSLSLVAAHLRIDVEDLTELHALNLAAAVDYAQSIMEVSLMPQTVTAVFNAEDVEMSPPPRRYEGDALAAPLGMPIAASASVWGADGRAPTIRLPRGPVSSVTSATDNKGNAFTAFMLERTPRGDRLRLTGGVFYPLKVVYQAGFANAMAVPATIRAAILAHVGTLSEFRESAGKAVAAVPHSLEAFYRAKGRQAIGG